MTGLRDQPQGDGSMATGLTTEQIERRQQLLGDHRRGKHFLARLAGHPTKWTVGEPTTWDRFPDCPACARGWLTYDVVEPLADATVYLRISQTDEYIWHLYDLTGLTPEEEYRARDITVRGPDKRLGSEFATPARVNWSALGSQSPEVTMRYARLLQIAAEIAEELDAAS